MAPQHNPEVQAILDADVELDRRSEGKLEVALWWVKNTLTTYITIEDYGLSEDDPTIMRALVPEGERPYEVFHHPFRYPGEPVLGGVNV